MKIDGAPNWSKFEIDNRNIHHYTYSYSYYIYQTRVGIWKRNIGRIISILDCTKP